MPKIPTILGQQAFEAIRDQDDQRHRTFLLMNKDKAREMAWPKNF